MVHEKQWKSFSDRNKLINTSEISIMSDAPDEIRYAVVQNAYDCNLSYTQIRDIVCCILSERPDRNNWSEIPNVRDEVMDLVENCEWYKVYDIAERLFGVFAENYGTHDRYRESVDRIFFEKGIGFQFSLDGQIVYRGDKAFESATEKAREILSKSNKPRATIEIEEALKDISHRPADITGSMTHAMGALESVANDIGGGKKTLGELINHLGIPSPLNTALSKLWGFASNNARHIYEEKNPRIEDAELVVHVCAIVCTYLIKKHNQGNDDSK